MSSFADKEQTRPEFHGEFIRSPIDGKLEAYFPLYRKVLRMCTAQAIVWVFIILVVTTVGGIIYLRKVWTDAGNTNAKIYCSIIMSIQIQIFNQIYGNIVMNLNEYENHRTDTEYENNLIAKSFLFKFVNSYNSLFYIAFLKGGIENNCDAFTKDDGTIGYTGDCLADLSYGLAIVFGSLIVINNTLEVGIPALKGYLRGKKESKGFEDKEKSFPEGDFEMEVYESTFGDYDEMAIQFGFVCLFVVAFPLAPLLALANNILEVKVDSAKLIEVTRRPEPRGVYSIGTFFDIYSIIAYMSIITNIAIVIFYADEIEDFIIAKGKGDDMTMYKAWMAVLAEHLVILMKFSIEYFIPDEPTAVQQHLARQQYLVGVLIQGAEEDADDDDDLRTTTVEETNNGPATFNLADIPKAFQKDNHTFW
jgi:anoctamin-10/anoctamin-7